MRKEEEVRGGCLGKWGSMDRDVRHDCGQF